MGIFSRKRKEKKEKVIDPKIKTLIDDFSDKDVEVRKKAIRKLRRIGEPAVEPLLETFRSPFDIFWGPSEALARIGEPSVEPLVRILKDKKSSELMRLGAALSFLIMSERANRYDKPLISVLKEKAVEPLIKTLTKDYCKGIRWTEAHRYIYGFICQALGTIGDTRAVKPLKRASEVYAYDKQAQDTARNALNKIKK